VFQIKNLAAPRPQKQKRRVFQISIGLGTSSS